MKNKVVLISPIGGQAIYGIIQYFKAKGFRIVGIDSNQLAIGKYFVDKFYLVPKVGQQDYEIKIYEILECEKVDFFISWLDSEIMFWNARYFSNEIPQHLSSKFLINFRKDFLDFYDKWIFYNKLVEKGFATPESYLFLDIIARKHNIKYPLILKPRTSSGSRYTFKLEDEIDLDYYVKYFHKKNINTEDFIVQSFLNGMEYTIDFFSLNGEVLNFVIRLRMEHKGISIIGKVIHSERIEAVLRDFVRTFHINGLNNIQVIEINGDIYILELNQRPSGTIMLSINSGVDLLNNFIEYKMGKNITIYGKPKEIWMCRYYCEYYYE